MKFAHILNALYRQPLLITPAGFASIDAVVRPHLLAGKLPDLRAANGNFVLGETDIFGTDLPPMLTLVGGIAIIAINGPLLQHAALIDKSCGACSYDDISAALDEAAEMGPRSTLLKISSPGGEHTGCPELANQIAELCDSGMDIYAFTDSQMASAAYYLAAGCKGIYATGSSWVGSIGSMIGFLDTTGANDKAGLKTELFVSGPLKGTAADGVPVSDPQRLYLQQLVDTAAESFKDFVRNARRDVAEDTMQGQCLYGSQAEAAGLIDRVVNDLDEVLGYL